MVAYKDQHTKQQTQTPKTHEEILEMLKELEAFEKDIETFSTNNETLTTNPPDLSKPSIEPPIEFIDVTPKNSQTKPHKTLHHKKLTSFFKNKITWKNQKKTTEQKLHVKKYTTLKKKKTTPKTSTFTLKITEQGELVGFTIPNPPKQKSKTPGNNTKPEKSPEQKPGIKGIPGKIKDLLSRRSTNEKPEESTKTSIKDKITGPLIRILKRNK